MARYAFPLLETNAVVEHESFYGQPCGHPSVTEMELCEASTQEAMAQQHADEIYAENAWLRYAEGGWDVHGSYAAESFAEGPFGLL
jgi:hypothetical protein